jgi:hypothetical protein
MCTVGSSKQVTLRSRRTTGDPLWPVTTCSRSARRCSSSADTFTPRSADGARRPPFLWQVQVDLVAVRDRFGRSVVGSNRFVVPAQGLDGPTTDTEAQVVPQSNPHTEHGLLVAGVHSGYANGRLGRTRVGCRFIRHQSPSRGVTNTVSPGFRVGQETQRIGSMDAPPASKLTIRSPTHSTNPTVSAPPHWMGSGISPGCGSGGVAHRYFCPRRSRQSRAQPGACTYTDPAGCEWGRYVCTARCAMARSRCWGDAPSVASARCTNRTSPRCMRSVRCVRLYAWTDADVRWGTTGRRIPPGR